MIPPAREDVAGDRPPTDRTSAEQEVILDAVASCHLRLGVGRTMATDPADFGGSYAGLAEEFADYTGRYGVANESRSP